MHAVVTYYIVNWMLRSIKRKMYTTTRDKVLALVLAAIHFLIQYWYWLLQYLLCLGIVSLLITAKKLLVLLIILLL